LTIDDGRPKIEDSRFETQDSRFKTQDSRFKIQDIQDRDSRLEDNYTWRQNDMLEVSRHLLMTLGVKTAVDIRQTPCT